MSVHSIADHGAVNDGTTNNHAAIQKAIDACHASGGGRVIVPAGGVYMSGTLSLKTGVQLHLENGATLRASSNKRDFTMEQIAGEYGGNEGAFFIHASDAFQISITGQGTLDGNAEAFLDGWWTDDGPYIRAPKAFRPRVIGLYGCHNVRIRDLTIFNAPQWSCHLTGCEDVVIHGITIRNGLDVPNCDGIDPDHCRNVRISDCHIEAGDDGIVIKTTRENVQYGPSENITITGCTIVSTSAAIKVGTESVADIRDIVVSNCVIRRSHRGLAIQLRDEGNVENVLFSNCVVETRQFHPKWWGNAEAVYITAVPRHEGKPVGTIQNVICRDIVFRGENGVYLSGSPESRLQDIVLDGVRGTLRKTSRFPVNFHDLRPCRSAEHGGLDHGTLSGITARHVDGLAIRHCQISFAGDDCSHWNKELETEDVNGLTVEGFEESHPEA